MNREKEKLPTRGVIELNNKLHTIPIDKQIMTGLQKKDKNSNEESVSKASDVTINTLNGRNDQDEKPNEEENKSQTWKGKKTNDQPIQLIPMPVYGRKNTNIKEFLLINSQTEIQPLYSFQSKTHNNRKGRGVDDTNTTHDIIYDNQTNMRDRSFNMKNEKNENSVYHDPAKVMTGSRSQANLISNMQLRKTPRGNRRITYNYNNQTYISPHTQRKSLALEYPPMDLGKVDLSDNYFITIRRHCIRRFYGLKKDKCDDVNLVERKDHISADVKNFMSSETFEINTNRNEITNIITSPSKKELELFHNDFCIVNTHTKNETKLKELFVVNNSLNIQATHGLATHNNEDNLSISKSNNNFKLHTETSNVATEGNRWEEGLNTEFQGDFTLKDSKSNNYNNNCPKLDKYLTSKTGVTITKIEEVLPKVSEVVDNNEMVYNMVKTTIEKDKQKATSFKKESLGNKKQPKVHGGKTALVAQNSISPVNEQDQNEVIQYENNLTYENKENDENKIKIFPINKNKKFELVNMADDENFSCDEVEENEKNHKAKANNLQLANDLKKIEDNDDENNELKVLSERNDDLKKRLCKLRENIIKEIDNRTDFLVPSPKMKIECKNEDSLLINNDVSNITSTYRTGKVEQNDLSKSILNFDQNSSRFLDNKNLNKSLNKSKQNIQDKINSLNKSIIKDKNDVEAKWDKSTRNLNDIDKTKIKVDLANRKASQQMNNILYNYNYDEKLEDVMKNITSNKKGNPHEDDDKKIITSKINNDKPDGFIMDENTRMQFNTNKNREIDSESHMEMEMQRNNKVKNTLMFSHRLPATANPQYSEKYEKIKEELIKMNSSNLNLNNNSTFTEKAFTDFSKTSNSKNREKDIDEITSYNIKSNKAARPSNNYMYNLGGSSKINTGGNLYQFSYLLNNKFSTIVPTQSDMMNMTVSGQNFTRFQTSGSRARPLKADKARLFFNLDEVKERLVDTSHQDNGLEGHSYILNHRKIPLIGKEHCTIYPSNEIDYLGTRHRKKYYSHINTQNN
jgi:hypothetical protein